eukprot:88431-Lingulodinium_polyedra.AAC.1
MPCAPALSADDGNPHRRKVCKPWFPLPACVARPVGKAELERGPAARAARDKEWIRLRGKYVWGEANPSEWRDVCAEA